MHRAQDLSLDSDDEDRERTASKGKQQQGSWKPQVHFVWDLLLNEVLSPSETAHKSFPEFFRILVDGMSVRFLIHVSSLCRHHGHFPHVLLLFRAFLRR